MPRIDELPDFRASLPRKDHHLDHAYTFTATCAHLMPVFHDFLNAGESVNLGFDYKIITNPLVSAAMSRIKVHTEYFFVPINLLYQPFGSWYYGIKDEYSSSFTKSVQIGLPLLSFNDLLSDIRNDANQPVLVYGSSAVPCESVGQNAMRFLDMLGLPGADHVMSATGADYIFNAFPYQILAYNCIYQYYYRLDNREVFNNKAFNFDMFYNKALVDNDDYDYRNLLMKYRPLEDDYFTDIKVSPIVDVLNLNNKSILETTNSWLTRVKNQSNESIISSGDVTGKTVSTFVNANLDGDAGTKIQTKFGVSSASNATPISGSNDFNTANIRAIFANEKLWSITGRAKKHYDDQTLAHFGFNVPHDPKHEISCFGHDVAQIDIGPVISTANTYNGSNGSPIGEIAGKGFCNSSGNKHKFTAPCHGVVMVIMSIVPDINYVKTTPKYNVIASRSDLYQPEYDHLGMQPLFGYECNLTARETDILGWQYRYEQWKRRYNRASPAFAPTNYGDGVFKSWINSKNPYSGTLVDAANTESYAAFLHLPNELNQLFVAQYPDSWNTEWTKPSQIYDYDPFIINSYINCTKVSTMSDFSLPRLDA